MSHHPRLRALLALLFATTLAAQSPQPTVPTPTFDVVSITPSKPDALGTSIETHEATFTGTNLDLLNLLINAFPMTPDRITGLPSWAPSTHWDIKAKIIDPDLPSLRKLTADQRRAMLVQLLSDRFHLKTHTEVKQLPIYNLVVLPRGPKFKPSTKQGQGMGASDHDVTLNDSPISSFTYFLSSHLHRIVVDQTNLTAHYDLHLTWAPEDPAHTAGLDTGQPADTGPSLFSAIQDQLGLKLVPAKGPVPTLVVDHVDRPTPN